MGNERTHGKEGAQEVYRDEYTHTHLTQHLVHGNKGLLEHIPIWYRSFFYKHIPRLKMALLVEMLCNNLCSAVYITTAF